MSFSSTGRHVKLLKENYLEPQFEDVNEKLDYIITLIESGMSKDELDNIKKKLVKKQTS